MKNKRYLLIICVAAAVILAVGVFFAFGKDSGAPVPSPTPTASAEVLALPESSETAEELSESTPTASSGVISQTFEEQPPGTTVGVDSDNETPLRCSMSISCATILDNMDKLDSAKAGIVPRGGIIYAEKTFEFSEGETVFDVLLRETRANKIHMEYSKTPAYDSAYIEGIGNLYEFDCGPLSGWLYKVNGEFSGCSCSRYTLKDGDRIEFLYTCDSGRDIGAEGVEQR